MGRKAKRSPEAQRRIVRQLLQGTESYVALARKHRISDQTLYRWQKKLLASGETFPLVETTDPSPSNMRDPQQQVFESHLDTFVRCCPVCGSNMTADYRNPRTVITISPTSFDQHWTGWRAVKWRLISRIRRCHNSPCNRFLIPYRPEIEGRIAFPNQKLGLLLLKQLDLLHGIGSENQRRLSNRQIQARLSASGINLPHTTIANALERLDTLPRDPSIGVRNFLRNYPKQKCFVLDIFPWTMSYQHCKKFRHNTTWIVRDCFSGTVLFMHNEGIRTLFRMLLPVLPIPVLGVLCPKSSTSIPWTIRRFLPQLRPVALPPPTFMGEIPPTVRGPLAIPVSYWQVPLNSAD